MNRPQTERAALALAVAAAAANPVSVAACHILIAVALVWLVASRTRLQVPPVWVPLLVFFGWTLASLALSEHPAEGLPQIKKFYVFLLLVVVYSGVRTPASVRLLLFWVAGATTLSATWGIWQFVEKFRAAQLAGRPFYESYVAAQITGFMSHWMTFSGELMIAITLVVSYLFFSGQWRRGLPVSLGMAAILSLALVLAFTRAIWGATALAGLYLVWCWKRWVLALVPPALALAFWLAPAPLQDRVVTIWSPAQAPHQLNSSEHRAWLRATGYRMIEAHPWFGVGPQQVVQEFQNFYPAEAPHPIPSNWYYAHLHNVYIHYAAERGIPAVLALLWFIGKAVLDFARRLRRLPPGPGESRWILQGILAAILGTLAAAWWELNLGDSEVLGLFVSLIACGYVVIDAGTKREAIHG